jgi:hypothetical protein
MRGEPGEDPEMTKTGKEGYMRKPKEQTEEDGNEAHFFEDFESNDDSDDSADPTASRDARRQKKPARQRVELRNEQQSLRRQLSDWDDYGQDDIDVKL